MPELSRFFGIVISVFFDDHNPPHIHASHGDRKRPEWAAQITIRDGKIIEGDIPSVALKLVRSWLKRHQEELYEAWDDAMAHREPKKIPPLRVR